MKPVPNAFFEKAPLLNSKILASMGYRPTQRTVLDKESYAMIFQLKRIDGADEPGFCYCSPVGEDVGFLMPHRITFYEKSRRNPAKNSRRDAADPDCFQNIPIISREDLESLGYRITAHPVDYSYAAITVLPVERVDDGTRADFTFCVNADCTAGIVLPHPIEYFTALAGAEVTERMEEEEELYG
jgi:hypothetical protein